MSGSLQSIETYAGRRGGERVRRDREGGKEPVIYKHMQILAVEIKKPGLLGG
jgi:hypothetical protein